MYIIIIIIYNIGKKNMRHRVVLRNLIVSGD